MGIDYSVNLGIGYIIDSEDLFAPFRVDIPEKSHMEDRFDPKTGKKIAPVKVVDEEACEEYEYKGKRYEDVYDLSHALAKDLECGISNNGGYSDGDTYYVTVDVATDDSGLEEGRFIVGGAAKFDDVTAMRAQLTKLKKAFKKLGIDLGEAKVFPQWDIS